MMIVTARRARSLPTNFDLYVYREMHEWLKHKPTMTPPHFHDLINPNDRNLQPPFQSAPINLEEASADQVPLDNSTVHAYTSTTAYDSIANCEEDSSMHPIESQTLPIVNEVHSSFPSPSMQSNHRFVSNMEGVGMRFVGDLNCTALVSPLQGRNGRGSEVHGQSCQLNAAPTMGGHIPTLSATPVIFPMGGHSNDPNVLSSFDTSIGRSCKPTVGSTGIRRKKNVAIQSMAEATLQESEKLGVGLKDMNGSAQSLHQKMLDMEMRMHKENMRYKQDKDKRMQELARLALLNQSTMATAMVTMAEVVKASRNPNDHPKP